MRVPAMPDAWGRFLITRWDRRGRCPAMHPDHRAKLQCQESPGHEKDGTPHTATMLVKW